VLGCNLKRSTTFILTDLDVGNSCRSSTMAANVSWVAPQQKRITTLGSPPWSLLAHSQMDALGAVLDGRVHVHVLEVQLLVADDYINVVLAPQAVVSYRQEKLTSGGM
jgi:hypothetical protein